jgi:hypothetical protein
VRGIGGSNRGDYLRRVVGEELLLLLLLFVWSLLLLLLLFVLGTLRTRVAIGVPIESRVRAASF